MPTLPQLSFACLLLTGSCWANSQDWPQWRGLTRDGASPGKSWPGSLDEASLKSLWKVDLEPSYSGPVIQDGTIFTTETANQEREVVRAFSLASGEQQWTTEWEGMMRVPFFAKANGSWIRSTPATDGERLFVAGMRDVLVCLDATSGSELWRLDFVDKFGTDLPSFGFVCSPLLTNESVIVQAGASVVALSKKDGSILWRSLEDGGGMNGSAFSSPIIREVNGVRQLLVQTRTELCGLDPDRGTVLWKQKIPAFRGMNILTPTVYEDTIFTATYGGKALGIGLQKGEDSWGAETRWEVEDGGLHVFARRHRWACLLASQKPTICLRRSGDGRPRNGKPRRSLANTGA